MPPAKSISKGWIFFFLLLVGAGAAYRYWPRPQPIDNQAVRRPVVAILIFENLNQEPELNFLANALTRETILKLGQLCSSGLDVIAHDSVDVYRGAPKPLHQIGRELGVDYIVEGGVREKDSRLEVQAKLRRVSDEAVLWSEEYDRPLSEASFIQNALIEKIADSLHIQVNPAEREAMNRDTTDNAVARDSFFRGLDQCERGSEADVRRCIASFRQAIQTDPHYPRAYAALADALLQQIPFLRGSAKENYEEAEKNARTALDSTTAIPIAHAILAEVLYRYHGDDKAAESEFRSAIALNRSDAEIHLRYAEFLLARNRLDEAQSEIETVLDLDPFGLDANLLYGRILTAAKLYDRAVQQLEKTVGLARDSAVVRYYLGRAYADRKMTDDAIREFEKAVSFNSGNADFVEALGEAYADAGRMEEARAQLTRLRELARTGHASPALIQMLSRRIKPS